MIRVLLALLLAILLTGCSPGNPPSRVIAQAIALQLNQTQAQLDQLLYRDVVEPPQATIRRIAVRQRERVTIQNIPSYHLHGTYDLKLKFSDHQVTQRRNPFDLYLQPHADDHAWYVARPQSGDRNHWETVLVEAD